MFEVIAFPQLPHADIQATRQAPPPQKLQVSSAFPRSPSRSLPLVRDGIKTPNTAPENLRFILAALGQNFNQQYVEHQTRCSKLLGTNPLHIKRLMETSGLFAILRNYSSTQTIMSILDSGGYVMAIVAEGHTIGYELVHGYRKLPGEKAEFLVTRADGKDEYISQQKFDKSWVHPMYHGFDLGFHRCLIAISKGKIICERISGNAARNCFIHARLCDCMKLISDVATTVSWFAKAVAHQTHLTHNSDDNTSHDKCVSHSYGEQSV